ncbi:uncharacterized protein KGF55_003857 [Candida pseudojiufengensis]|uniref:uncharacterized protein n=1 Tax=Candida pseudojiufengensis TaxID=497109 RepID=UPI0022244840|nr:uncharacterized protein KGF55_003857 [Candida pseudojiufengensis]KAI5961886.1 hypothetical protein KGF55_003857 [Candida pseudojiufengensis]
MSNISSNPQSEQTKNQQSQSQTQKSNDPLATRVEDLYLESYAFTTAAAIVGSVDRKIFVLLRDGRSLFGILRTFDQFANLVLQDTFERIYLNDQNNEKFGETYRGVFMVRGENVVMMGELDIDKEDDHLEKIEQIPFEEVEHQLKIRHSNLITEEKRKTKNFLHKGLVNDFYKSDLY